MSIEKNMDKLDKLTKELENNVSLSINESLKLFNEAIILAKSCIEDINKSKGELTLLSEELKKITSGEDILND